MSIKSPAIHLSSTLDLALLEMEKIQDRVRICHSHLTTSSSALKNLQREVETYGIALATIQRGFEGMCDKKIQRRFDIFRLDYECLVDRVHCARSKSLVPLEHAARSSTSPSLTSTSSLSRTPSFAPPIPPTVIPERKEKIGEVVVEAATKPRHLPSRAYLSFPTTDFVLIPISPTYNNSIQEFENVLDDLGLLRQLKVEVTHGGSPSIRFQLSSLEIYALRESEKYRILRQYFESFERGVPAPSAKNLVEHPDCSSRNESLTADLLREADSYFGRLPSPLSPVRCTIPPTSLDSERNMLKEVYVTQNFDGLCVGEYHNQQLPKKFILDNLEAMAGMGITTLFIENLCYDILQPYLDEYYASSTDTMPPLLETTLDSLDSTFHTQEPYTYKALVKNAKSVGIRVVGIDTSVSVDAGWIPLISDYGRDRYAAMNYVAQKIINHEKGWKGPGKYLALMGAAHGSETQRLGDKESRPSVPGVATLLQRPFFVIRDSEKDEVRAEVNVPVTDAVFKYEHVHLNLKKPVPQV